MTKTVAYIRVSTEDQATDGVSLAAQRAKIEAWCVVNDSELLEVHSDAGISGGRADNRPGLQAAIETACKQKAVLVVYSLSRLARSTKDTILIGEKLDKAGADLVSLSEKIDTTSAAGKMVFRMLAVMAEFEKDQISERTKFAMQHKKSKSERVGTIPYGYDLAIDGVELIKNSTEQSAIELVNELNSRGMSLRVIADELTARGYLTKKGKDRWNHMTVKNILNRKAS